MPPGFSTHTSAPLRRQWKIPAINYTCCDRQFVLLQPKISPQHAVGKVMKMHPVLGFMLPLKWQHELQKVTSQKVLNIKESSQTHSKLT